MGKYCLPLFKESAQPGGWFEQRRKGEGQKEEEVLRVHFRVSCLASGPVRSSEKRDVF